jgi:hypothetical protein
VQAGPALHSSVQSEHTRCGDTAQYVPNRGSVKPPDEGHVQSALLPAYSCVGAVVQMVAASFQALQAAESPALYGYEPPSAVGSVAVYEVVLHPAIGHGKPWYKLLAGGGDGGLGLYARYGGNAGGGLGAVAPGGSGG